MRCLENFNSKIITVFELFGGLKFFPIELLTPKDIENQLKITQVNKIRSTFCPETKPLVNIQFWVAESESGIRFFPSRQNFAVLPISWLPGLKISFSSFSEKLWEISKI